MTSSTFDSIITAAQLLGVTTLLQIKTLSFLSENDGSTTPKSITSVLRTKPGNVTQILDRLETLGLIERIRPVPSHDRRSYVVTLTKLAFTIFH